MAFPDNILAIATSRDWLALGFNLILSTAIGGIVMVVILTLFSKLWKEGIKIQNAFMLVFAVTVINLFGLLALAPSFPFAGLLLPVFVWIGLTKLAFRELGWIHAVIVGVVGYGVSIFLVPELVARGMVYVPKLAI